jgi:hypothetical protein
VESHCEDCKTPLVIEISVRTLARTQRRNIQGYAVCRLAIVLAQSRRDSAAVPMRVSTRQTRLVRAPLSGLRVTSGTKDR